MLSRRQILIGTGLITGAAVVASRQLWWTPRKVLDPPTDTKQGNRIFLPVRFENELEDLLLIKRPLLLNFTIRGDPYCNKVTGALQRIVAYETDHKINMVDIETDELTTRDLLPRFGVKNIPTIVAVKKTLPVDSYVDENLLKDPESEVDWIKLKQFVEKNADSPDQ